MQLNEEEQKLAKMAIEAISLSYSPYSHYSVGAAVKLSNGKMVKGANQENVSYPVGICAERSTLATAQNLFPNVPVTAIALAASAKGKALTPDIVTPCGMCRQALLECENRYNNNIKVIMLSAKEVLIAESVKELLPAAFF